MVMAYTTALAKKFQKEFTKYAKEEVKKQSWDITQTKDRDCILEATFYFHKINLDDQNHYKVVSDCLNGIAYYDDKHVIVRTKKQLYDNVNPRIELSIKLASYIGVFDNDGQLDKFESNCQSCSRYVRNCSILKKAKEGRIQEELDHENLICHKYKEKKG